MIPIYVRPPKALSGSKKGIKWDDPHCSLQQIKYKKLFCLRTKTDSPDSETFTYHMSYEYMTYESGPRSWSTRRAPWCSSTPRCFGQQNRTYIVKALSVIHNHHVPPPPPPPWRIHEEGLIFAPPFGRYIWKTKMLPPFFKMPLIFLFHFFPMDTQWVPNITWKKRSKLMMR